MNEFLNATTSLLSNHADHVLDYLGHLVQHPDVKISHAILIAGEPGAGKTAFGAAIAKIVGDEKCVNVAGVGPKTVVPASWLDQTLLIVDENPGRITNTLKVLITSEMMVRGNNMGMGRTPRGVILLTNASICPGVGSRRVYVAQATGTRSDAQTLQALLATLDDGACAEIRSHLAERDLTNFNPLGGAPPQ